MLYKLNFVLNWLWSLIDSKTHLRRDLVKLLLYLSNRCLSPNKWTIQKYDNFNYSIGFNSMWTSVITFPLKLFCIYSKWKILAIEKQLVSAINPCSDKVRTCSLKSWRWAVKSWSAVLPPNEGINSKAPNIVKYHCWKIVNILDNPCHIQKLSVLMSVMILVLFQTFCSDRLIDRWIYFPTRSSAHKIWLWLNTVIDPNLSWSHIPA